MVGQFTLMQGPFGVTASARREPPRPVASTVRSATEMDGAGFDKAPSHPNPSPPSTPEKHDQDQYTIESVAPQTLFEASRIAALLPPDSDAPFIPAQLPSRGWQPPHSSFHLRDRTI